MFFIIAAILGMLSSTNVSANYFIDTTMTMEDSVQNQDGDQDDEESNEVSVYADSDSDETYNNIISLAYLNDSDNHSAQKKNNKNGQYMNISAINVSPAQNLSPTNKAEAEPGNVVNYSKELANDRFQLLAIYIATSLGYSVSISNS